MESRDKTLVSQSKTATIRVSGKPLFGAFWVNVAAGNGIKCNVCGAKLRGTY